MTDASVLLPGDEVIIDWASTPPEDRKLIISDLRERGVKVITTLLCGGEGGFRIRAILRKAPAMPEFHPQNGAQVHDCPRTDRHFPHTFPSVPSEDGGSRAAGAVTLYCKGVPS